MKNLIKYLFLFIIIPALVLSSCKKDPIEEDRVTDTEFQTLITYMQTNGDDLNNILDGWITTAATIKDNLTSYYIIDIRSATDYDVAHIPGAVNSTLGNILVEAENSASKPIIVVCYSGQSAGHGVCALRLSGFNDAKVLKWGMSGWGPTWSGSWDNNTGDAAVDHANWIAAPGSIAETKEFDDPDITNTGTGAEILAARVATLLAGGFTPNAVSGSDVLTNPGNYFVNNYWGTADVQLYGHIAGAYRINPLTLSGEEYFGLNPDKPVVTYCWTGQTSSVIAAYLDIIGYDAKTLKFGSNAMIYSNLQSHKWATPTVDLPTE